MSKPAGGRSPGLDLFPITVRPCLPLALTVMTRWVTTKDENASVRAEVSKHERVLALRYLRANGRFHIKPCRDRNISGLL